MSRRAGHVLAALLLLGSQTLPTLAADSSQVNFKIFSAPGMEAPKEDTSKPDAAESASGAGEGQSSSSAESMWTEGDSSSQAPPGSTAEPAQAASPSTAAESSPSPAADTSADSSSGTNSTSVESAASGESNAASGGESGETKVLQGYIRIVPSGTKVPIIMDSAVDSDTSQEGDEFAARTSEDLTIDGSTVVPAGSVIKGRIARLNSPRHLNRSGSVALKFDTVTTPDNKQIPLTANLVARGGVVHARRGLKDVAIDTGTFVAPAAVGTLIGAIAGSSNSGSSGIGTAGGLLIGAGIGIAIGTIILCAKKGKRVDVRPGDELKIELAEDLRMPM